MDMMCLGVREETEGGFVYGMTVTIVVTAVIVIVVVRW